MVRGSGALAEVRLLLLSVFIFFFLERVSAHLTSHIHKQVSRRSVHPSVDGFLYFEPQDDEGGRRAGATTAASGSDGSSLASLPPRHRSQTNWAHAVLAFLSPDS